MTSMQETLRGYQAFGIVGTTHFDLILAVYDALAQDLNRIGEAVSAGDIEERCRVTNHALLLLGYLETWIERLQEPELERSLAVFYSFVRAELMRLQAYPVVASARALAMMVCETRAAWQQKRGSVICGSSENVAARGMQPSLVPSESTRLGWSA